MFQIGDEILFYVPHDEFGDIELTGKIIKINDDFADVEHAYGIATSYIKKVTIKP